MTLRGRHVLLRPIEPADFGPLYSIELSPENIYRWRFRASTPSPEQYARSLFEGVLASFVVESTDSGSIVGVVTCYNADLKNGVAYLAALSAEVWRRRPAAIEGIELLIDYCFQNWQFRKLYLESPEYCQVEFASAPERLLREEARLVDHEFFDGRYWDRLILALHRTDWENDLRRRASQRPPDNAEEFLDLVRVELLLDESDMLTISSSLNDIQLDSLSLYALVVLVEELAGEAVLDPVLDQWRSLDDVYSWLEQRLPGRG